MHHPLLEIHFEDVREQFEPIVKNWYHRPQVGDYIEIDAITGKMIGTVVSVGWVDGPTGEYMVARIK